MLVRPGSRQHRPDAAAQGLRAAEGGSKSGSDSEVEADDDSRHEAKCGGSGSTSRKRKGPDVREAEVLATDAQLSCPVCFTTVCFECQRHTRYHNQVSSS